MVSYYLQVHLNRMGWGGHSDRPVLLSLDRSEGSENNDSWRDDEGLIDHRDWGGHQHRRKLARYTFLSVFILPLGDEVFDILFG